MFRHLKHILTTGSIAPMSPKVSRRVPAIAREYVGNFSESVVVEFGPGTGNITEHLVSQGWKEIHCFEVIPEFVEILQEKFADSPNVYVHHKSAEEILEVLPEQSVDAVITTIPLSLLQDKIDTILGNTFQALKPQGIVVSCQVRTIQNKYLKKNIGPQIHRERARDLQPTQTTVYRKLQ